MLRIDDSEESGIEEIENSKSVNRKYFDLQGRRVNGKPARGIYIREGKKIMIK